MSDFANMFAVGGAPLLQQVFGSRGAVLIHPPDSEQVAVEGAIIFPEDKRTEVVGGTKQVIRERAVQLFNCPCELAEPLRADTRTRVFVYGSCYRVTSCNQGDVGVMDLTLRREEMVTTGNPSLFRQQ